MKKFLLLGLIFIAGFISKAHAELVCDPVVSISSNHKTLSDALVYLAQENEFVLSFPKGLDQKLVVNESMPLDKMIKYLTRDLNTLLSYRKSKTCSGRKLTELIVVPSGKDSEFISIDAEGRQQKNQQKTKEYTYIEDMDIYAREVKKGTRKANLSLMSPEQRVSYKYSRRKLQNNRY